MKLVTDTNILFSACITPAGKIADFLFNPHYKLEKYAAHFVVIELFKYQNKMLKISKLSEEDFLEVLYSTVKAVNFINETQISPEHWLRAKELVADINPKDDVHVALALQQDALLWTDDMVLYKGLKEKGFTQIVHTQELATRLAENH